MNLLAHAFLANANPDQIVGQLCGDFVRGTNLESYPVAIQAGIRCHRSVDSYTDAHPVNLAARDLFKAPYRRFAGVAVDVIYDHFLASEWHNYSDLPLAQYTSLVNQSLHQHRSLLPAGLQSFADLLLAEDTMGRNLDRRHIDLTLQRIASRRKSLAPLATIAAPMWQLKPQLKQGFDSFFPQLIDYTRQLQQEKPPEGD